MTVNGELVAGSGTRLSLAGATLAGAGTITATDWATVEVASTTVLPDTLTLHLQTANFATATTAPSDTRLHIDGTVVIDAGSLFGPALHLRAKGRVGLGPSTTAVFQSDFVLTNDGVLEVAAGAALQLQGNATVRNNGILTLHAPVSVTGGRIDNAGLLQTVDADTVELVDTQLQTFAAAPPLDPQARVGAIALRAGVLHVAGQPLGMADGGLYLLGGALRATLVLSGGYLTGQGTVTGTVTNNGWIDLTGPGLLTIDGELDCGIAGNLVVPGPVWLGHADTLLTVTGRALLGGSVWALQTRSPSTARSPCSPAPRSVPPSIDGAASTGVSGCGPPRPPPPSSCASSAPRRACSMASTARTTCRSADRTAPAPTSTRSWAPPTRTPRGRPSLMYLASPLNWAGDPFPRRVTQDATASLATLTDQGWGIMPVYWGQNNYASTPGDPEPFSAAQPQPHPGARNHRRQRRVRPRPKRRHSCGPRDLPRRRIDHRNARSPPG